MAIAEGNTATVSSVAASDWVKLVSGTNRVYVSCGTWSTTSVDMQISHNATTVYPLEYIGTALTVTSNKAFDVPGPGYLRMNCTAYASNAVTLLVTNPIDDRL